MCVFFFLSLFSSFCSSAFLISPIVHPSSGTMGQKNLNHAACHRHRRSRCPEGNLKTSSLCTCWMEKGERGRGARKRGWLWRGERERGSPFVEFECSFARAFACLVYSFAINSLALAPRCNCRVAIDNKATPIECGKTAEVNRRENCLLLLNNRSQ